MWQQNKCIGCIRAEKLMEDITVTVTVRKPNTVDEALFSNYFVLCIIYNKGTQ
jgi:hypothetical protein